MIKLHNELQTLGKCIKYQNLSQAAAHVGLSQPQLSRVISRLENEFDVSLLDRTARKKSAWTPIAFKIAETFAHNIDKLEHELTSVLDNTNLRHLSIGILEGLIPFSTQLLKSLFDDELISSVDLKVLDLSELELGFSKSDFDVILTIREPGRRKIQNIAKIGYQTLDVYKMDDEYDVYSSFEYSTLPNKQRKKPHRKTVVSNSLLFRQNWLRQVGGKGLLPSPITRKEPTRKGVESVYMIGSDSVPSKLWSALENKARGV